MNNEMEDIDIQFYIRVKTQIERNEILSWLRPLNTSFVWVDDWIHLDPLTQTHDGWIIKIHFQDDNEKLLFIIKYGEYV